MSIVTLHNPRTNKRGWILAETADEIRAMSDDELRAYRAAPLCAAFRNIRWFTDLEIERRGLRAAA